MAAPSSLGRTLHAPAPPRPGPPLRDRGGRHRLALAGSLAIASPAGADQLAYSCGADICLIDPDSPAEHSNLTQTTAGLGDERSPSWSPDGKLIAYIGSYGALTEGWDVFTLDPSKSAAEGEFTNLSETKDRGADFEHPAVWSPDGSRIAYPERYHSNAPPDLGEDLYVSPFDGSAPPLAISSNSQSQNSPNWLPDGNTLAFSQSGVTTLAAANGTGSTTTLANGAGVGPTMSPDGKYIAVEALGPYPYEMRIVNADGSGFHDLARPVNLGSTFDWSPDSTRIAYVSDEVSSEDQVRVAPADGSSAGVVVPMPSGWIVAHDPVISPDGTRVAFHARNESLGGWEQILVGPADGLTDAWAKPKPKPILFAKGDVKVPAGKAKPLKLKLTAAGRKLIKRGRTLKIQVTITKSQPGQREQKVTKTVKLKLPARKG